MTTQYPKEKVQNMENSLDNHKNVFFFSSNDAIYALVVSLHDSTMLKVHDSNLICKAMFKNQYN
jgi:hypothetical protein